MILFVNFASHSQLNSIQKTDQVLTCPFKPPTLLYMEHDITSEEFYKERAEAELLSREIEQQHNFYEEGRRDGQSALHSRGGTRGAVWNAEQRGLVGDDFLNYVQGFNDVLDEFDEYMEELSNEEI